MTTPQDPAPSASSAPRRDRRAALAFGLAALLGGLGLADAAVPAAPAPGPFPDFGRVGAVVSHSRLREVQPALANALVSALGGASWVNEFDFCGRDPGVDCAHWLPDGMTIWARDYSPIFVRRPDGRIKAVRTLSLNPNRPHDFDVATTDARHPLHAVFEPRAGAPGMLVEHLPIVHENGNLVTDGTRVFLTDRVYDDNTRPPRDPDIIRDGFAIRTREDIRGLLAAALERPLHDVIVLPSLPGDEARHADMFLMALDADTLLVPEIPAEAIRPLPVGPERRLAMDAAGFLNRVVSMLQERGLMVERLPMLPAALVPPQMGGAPAPVYQTPTNALLLDTGAKKRVLLPTVRIAGRPAAEDRLRATYEKAWAAFFAARGYAVERVDSTQVAIRHGLARCVSAVVPAEALPVVGAGATPRPGTPLRPKTAGLR